jgi:hypothetical protein
VLDVNVAPNRPDALSTPRSFARVIVWPPGSTAPTRASGTTSPAW